MRQELARMTDKLDNIRRLQEMGMLNSFRKFLNRNSTFTSATLTVSLCVFSNYFSSRWLNNRRKLTKSKVARSSWRRKLNQYLGADNWCSDYDQRVWNHV